jgi:AraC-like DNA-binding protein
MLAGVSSGELPYRERASRIAGATVWRRRTTTSVPGRILPDGCMDIIWRDGTLLVAGPDREAYVTSPVGGTSYVGLRLPPGTGPAVFGLPADRLLGRRVPLADVWSPADVRRALATIGDGAVGAGLEDVVLARLAQHGPDPLAAHVVDGLDAGRDVRDIADSLGLSERQLHRRSLAAFGYGPKTLARIRRMQRALAVPAPVGGAAVAAATGYADQAHLTREVRALAGVPFSRLRRVGSA